MKCLVAIAAVVATFCARTCHGATTSSSLCANEQGVFVGLAADAEAYRSVAGSRKEAQENRRGEVVDQPPQKWEVITSSVTPKNSYTGQFLQVLPDYGRSYPGQGVHMKHPKELENNSPYVSFKLHVTKEGSGYHVLFLRWTGGDTVGGGDSLYVVLDRIVGRKKRELMKGMLSVKPSMLPIGSGMSKYVGCCYDLTTHACPCLETVPGEGDCAYFVNRTQAAGFGAQCAVGGGANDIVKAPEWYLFAGQEDGDVMDFDSEPWDITCEAEGSNTRDSGHDFPSWNLGPGDYELRIYAREDGTALDGIYMAGPKGSAPSISMRYSAGDSTICAKGNGFLKKFLIGSMIGVAVLGAIGFGFSDRGRALIQGSAQAVVEKGEAVRYITVDRT